MDIQITTLSRVRRQITATANIRFGVITTVRSKPDGKGGWLKEPLIAEAPFGADILSLQHGNERWVESGGKKRPERKLAPMNEPKPKAVEGAQDIYVMPIHTAELGGRCDLIFDDKVSSEALAALFTELKTWDEYYSLQPLMIPHVTISHTEQTEDGERPVFEVLEWAPRPESWGPPLFKPNAKPQSAPEPEPEPQTEQWTPEQQELLRMLRERQAEKAA